MFVALIVKHLFFSVISGQMIFNILGLDSFMVGSWYSAGRAVEP